MSPAGVSDWPVGDGRGAKPRWIVAGDTLFFPLATIYAIFILPVSVSGMLGLTGTLPALASATGHAHEMLFGFALAVVAGNQLGPMSRWRLAVLVGLWMIARATFLSAPQSMMTAAANIAFAALLAAHLAPRLLHALKKLSSQALPLVLAAICISSIAFQLASHAGFTAAGRDIVRVAVLLFAMLMLFMGGRLIAPTIAGQLHRQEGGKLNARVQPRIEGSLLVAMTVAATASAFAGELPFVALAAVATALAGVLSMVRLLRWRLWGLRGRPDLLCLAAGYGWLAIGLFLYGVALAMGRYQTAALHVITIGALGTLTLNVMVMTWTLKARQDPARARAPVWATLLIGAATVARASASLGVYDPLVLLQLAAACWSGAFVLLLIRLVRVRPLRNLSCDPNTAPARTASAGNR